MIAPVVVGLMWRYMYHPTVGTFNRTLKSLGFEGVDWLGQHALLSVIIADIGQWTPFIFILTLAALQSLPTSALEAARKAQVPARTVHYAGFTSLQVSLLDSLGKLATEPGSAAKSTSGKAKNR